MADYLWRIPTWAKNRFDHLIRQLSNTEVEDDAAYALREEVRRLPGFPRDAHPDRDLIHIEIVPDIY